MKRVLLVFCLSVLVLTGATAQDTAITIENAGQLAQVAVLGFGEVNDLALTPNGKLLAAATSIGVLVTETRAPDAAEKLPGSEFYAVTVAVNPDGTRVAAGGWDFSLRVWDLETGVSLLETYETSAAVGVVAYSPDGSTLVSAGEDLALRFWNADTLTLRSTIGELPALINALAFSPDGAILAGAANDGRIHLWDVAGAKEIGILTGHETTARSVAFQPDGTLVSGDEFGRIVVWDAASQTQLTSLDNFQIPVWDIAVGADGQVLTAGGDETLRGRRLPDAQLTFERVNMPRYPLRAVSAAAGVVATASAQEISIWDAEHEEPVNRLWMPDKAVSAAYSPDGRQLAVGTTDGNVTIYDSASWSIATTLNAGRGAATALLFQNNGRLIVGWEDGTISPVDVPSAAFLAEYPAHSGVVVGLADPGEGNVVISAGHDGIVRITNLLNGEGGERERGDGRGFTSLAVDPVNRRMAVGSETGNVTLFEVGPRRARGGEKYRLPGDVIPGSVAFSRDGNTLAVGSDDGAVRFVALPILAETSAITSFFGAVYGLAYSPDGTWLAAASSDGYLRVFDSVSRDMLFEQHGHTSWATGVTIDPAGTRVVTIGEDGVARVWAVR